MRRVLLLVFAAALAAGALTRVDAAEAAPRVVVSASATGSGHAAALTSGRARGAAWTSPPAAIGVRLTARFAAPTSVAGTVLRGAGAGRRASDVLLDFSDGSTLAMHLDGAGSRSIVFPARRVTWVRLTIAAVPRGVRAVALASWTVTAATPSVRAAGVLRPRLTASTGSVGSGGWQARVAGAGQWLQVSTGATPIAAVRMTGGGAAIPGGWLTFSDGASIGVGAVEARGGAATTVAFTPRVTRWVRFTAAAPAGGAPAALATLTAYPVGEIPATTPTAATGYTAAAPIASTCSGVRAAEPSPTLTMLCPSNGDAVGARTTATLVVAGPPDAPLTASAFVVGAHGSGGAVRVIATARTDASGTGTLVLPLADLPRGPTAVRIASGAATLTAQLVDTRGTVQQQRPDGQADGMDLVYDDEFSGPLSATRTGAGARYASGKPNWYGVDDFGQAIFGQPTGDGQNLGTGSGALRIAGRALTTGETDPAGYGRRALGGLISSAHAGGSGFAAQYGYFEARVLAPAGAGTWPAFWLLSAGSLNHPHDATAEVDAMEQYGSDPSHAYQTAHNWGGSADPLGRSSVQGVADWPLTWHTYGARITPSGTVFTIDGRVTSVSPAVVDAGEPFFFLADLAYEQGWQQGLAGTGDRAALYVDWIRVWV